MIEIPKVDKLTSHAVDSLVDTLREEVGSTLVDVDWEALKTRIMSDSVENIRNIVRNTLSIGGASRNTRDIIQELAKKEVLAMHINDATSLYGVFEVKPNIDVEFTAPQCLEAIARVLGRQFEGSSTAERTKMLGGGWIPVDALQRVRGLVHLVDEDKFITVRGKTMSQYFAAEVASVLDSYPHRGVEGVVNKTEDTIRAIADYVKSR